MQQQHLHRLLGSPDTAGFGPASWQDAADLLQQGPQCKHGISIGLPAFYAMIRNIGAETGQAQQKSWRKRYYRGIGTTGASFRSEASTGALILTYVLELDARLAANFYST